MNIVRKLTTLLFILLSSFTPGIAFGAIVSSDEAAAYANVIQNLVANSVFKNKNGAFCIYGSDSVAKSLLRGNGATQISDISLGSSSKCRVIYISIENLTNIKLHLNELAANKILTIGTYDDFVENGGMIQVEMGRRDFELLVDIKALNTSQIKLDTLSSNLIVN